jgi:hypothetical protein
LRHAGRRLAGDGPQPPRARPHDGLLESRAVERLAPLENQRFVRQVHAAGMVGEPLAELAVRHDEPRARVERQLRRDDVVGERAGAHENLHVRRVGEPREPVDVHGRRRTGDRDATGARSNAARRRGDDRSGRKLMGSRTSAIAGASSRTARW